jgi:predicted regulator of Ras-like GTPase activity (Roadblock/LC7/MglB family)
MAKAAKKMDKKLEKKFENNQLPISEALSTVIDYLLDAGGFHSVILTDSSGLVLAEKLHPQVKRENYSAATALSADSAQRVSNYLEIGFVKYSFIETQNSKVWVKVIKIKETNDTLNLLANKFNQLIDRLPKATRKLLGRKDVDYVKLLDVASQWIQKSYQS